MITYKTPQEIEILREGGKHHARIVAELAGQIAPGVSTIELNETAEKRVREFGDSPAFLHYRPDGARRKYPAALCISVNDEIVHGIPNERPKILAEGDIVSLDLGLIHWELVTDMAVTLPVGEVSSDARRLIEATKEALEAGIAAARGGAHVGDIGAAIEAVARARGFSIAEGLAGHGVGYDVHEDPYVPNTGTVGEGELLKPGMVLAVEPMFTLGSGDIVLDKDGFTFKTRDGKNSAHFEHTIAITENEPIVLTKE
ncbi:type I methionyl aminopeptidase [Patescibacteria group bacterium]|nr:MAG: type I methionyl aminopeptidase [Patescibacteria group bacterium]